MEKKIIINKIEKTLEILKKKDIKAEIGNKNENGIEIIFPEFNEKLFIKYGKMLIMF